MSHFNELNSLLANQTSPQSDDVNQRSVYDYARAIASVENAVVVVSDLQMGTSRITSGDFGRRLGLRDGYSSENSIWENEILRLMPQEEREAKFVGELRFFHYQKRLPASRRKTVYLAARLRMEMPDGKMIDVMHTMHYVYAADSETIRYAICLYRPMTLAMPWRTMVIDSGTGLTEELSVSVDDSILSRRQRQILSMIDSGLTTAEIAGSLCISPHTVSRHRQEILSKLRVRNSAEACRHAKSMNLI